jgi:hypothetical protein
MMMWCFTSTWHHVVSPARSACRPPAAAAAAARRAQVGPLPLETATWTERPPTTLLLRRGDVILFQQGLGVCDRTEIPYPIARPPARPAVCFSHRIVHWAPRDWLTWSVVPPCRGRCLPPPRMCMIVQFTPGERGYVTRCRLRAMRWGFRRRSILPR